MNSKGSSKNRGSHISEILHIGKVKGAVRRFTAMFLSVCMVLTGFPSIPYALAADDDIEEFEILSEDLQSALENAMSDGTPISETAYRFSGDAAEEYEELFYWDDVYEITQDLEIEKDGKLTLQVFVKPVGDQQLDSYKFTGEEEVIFLIQNNTNDDRTARIYLDGQATELIDVPAKNSISLSGGPGEEVAEEAADVEDIQSETSEEDSPVLPAGEAPAHPAGGAGGSGSSYSRGDETYTDAEDNVDDADTAKDAETDENANAEASIDEGKEKEAASSDSAESSDASADDSSDSSDAGDDGSDSGDGSASSDSGSSESSDSGSEGNSSAEGGSASDSGNDSASSDSGNSGSDNSASESSGSDSGSTGTSDSSDSGRGNSRSGRGRSGSGRNSESGRSSSGSDSSDSGSDNNSGKTASVSAKNVGTLAASIEGITDDDREEVEPVNEDTEDDNDSADDDTEVENNADSDDDEEDIEAELASASDADEDSTYTLINGDVYKAVKINNRKAAVAFVTTLEDLNLKLSDVSRVALEEQTVKAQIYADEYYDWKLADGTTITLTGMMPEDAEAKAYPVEVEIEDIHVLAAYDITIYDSLGNEYQPEDGEIEVEIENDDIREALEYEHELTIFHMEDEDDEPEEIAVIAPAPRMHKVNFFAERFSIYVVGEDDELYNADHETRHYIYTVNFYIEDMSADPISTQTLSAGEYVEVPGVPEKEHAVFIGWYTEPNGGGTLYDLSSSNVLPEITEDTELDLFAHYTDAYYVYYMEFPLDTEFDEGLENAVFHTEVYHEYDAVLDTSTASELYRTEGLLAGTEAVTGWIDADENPAPEFVEDDLELYPVIDNAYWVYFDVVEAKETSVDPMYVLASATTIGDLPEASCTGYTFDGWYTDTDYRTRVTSSTTLASLNLGTEEGQNDSVTLYAKWTPAKVAYTVNIWRQKATDGAAGISNKTYVSGESYDEFIDYYDFAESHHVTAEDSTLYAEDSLASVNPTQSSSFLYQYTRYGTTSDNTSDYYGFEYATNRTQNNVRSITSVAADGSTVINIFYDRITITWNFGTSRNSTATGTLIGLYGTNCEADNPGGSLSGWPNTQSNQIWGYSTGSGLNSSTENVTFEATFVILDENTTLNFTSSSYSANCYGYYYLELTNENQISTAKEEEANNYKVAYTRQVNDTWYVYDRRINLSGGTFNFTDKYAGYYFAGYNKVSTGSTDNNTSYTEAKEGESDTFRERRSGGIGTSYNYFDGYFFNNAIEYTITLVSSDKNVGIADNGTLYDAGDGATYTFKYGTDLSDLTFPGTEELDGATWGPASYYEFDGIWMEDPLFTARFVIPSSMPANNLVAYADWELKDITVSFNTGSVETTYPDQVIKATETADDPGTPVREGYEFEGWMDQNNKIFNFATVLYDDTTLTAIWKDLSSEAVQGHTLTYDLNKDNSYGLLDEYSGETTSQNPEHFVSGAEEELWTIEAAFPDITSIEGAVDEFICWNTEKDGSGTNYYPDDEIKFDNTNITLYAIWANKDRNESTLILDHNYPSGYTPDEGENTTDEITQRNLTEIDLTEESNLSYHEEISVTSSDGTHYYRFEGWSTTKTDESSATDDDVDFAADDHVAVDTLTDASGNTLYAVWIEVYTITVTKEVENNAPNYTLPDDTTFEFTWSVITGDGETTEGTASGIADKGTFNIPDVAAGETVTITETAADGFKVSYNGAQGGTTDNGAYTFDMGSSSTDVTVTNTVTTNLLTVNKVWEDANGDEETDVEHDAVTVTVYEDEESLGELTLSSDNDWTDSLELVVKSNATYTVSEVSVAGYTTTVSEMEKDDTTGDVSFTVTNSEIPEIDIKVTKEWVDDGNRDNLETSISIQLYANDDVSGSPVSLTGENDNWTYTWESMPKNDDAGNEITYSVQEVEVPDGYKVTYSGDADSGFVITNTHEDYLVSEITITKVWDDEEDQDGKRPESVTFELQMNGSTVTDVNGESWTVELTEADADENDPDKWTTTVTDHPVYVNEDAQAISYTLHEDDVTEGYEATDGTVTITGTTNSSGDTVYTGDVTITNSHTPELYNTDGKLTVTKTWDDKDNQDGIRPANVSVTLSAVDSEENEVALPEEVEAKQTITASGNWTVTYEGLYAYANGKEIIYTVSEDAVDGYTTTYAPAYSQDQANKCGRINDGQVTITNTHTPETITIEGSKTWDDNDNQDGKRPSSITIRLMGDGSPVNEKIVTASDDWKWSFEGVDRYHNGGTEIVYTIVEAGVQNYTTTYEEGTYNVTNTYTPETTTVTITKAWEDDDDRDGKRPSEVTVTLSGTNDFSKTITLNEGNSWTATADVSVYYNEGETVTYSVTEDTVEGYETPAITSSDAYTFTVTNTHTPETVDVEGSKTWGYGNDPDTKPASITIRLLADGTEADSATVTEADNWVWSFTGLSKYRDGGTEIIYSITEDAVDNYATEVNGYDVINTYNPQRIPVTITKVWDDDNDRDGKRPSNVSVTLTGTNSFSQEITLNEGNSWSSTVEVPKYANDGSTVDYSVTEETVTGYEAPAITSINSLNFTEFTVKNTHTPETVDGAEGTITVKKVWEDEENQDGIRPDSVTVTLYADDDAAKEFTLSESNGWTDSVSGLYKYANGGKEITYTVTEAGITLPSGHEDETGYTASITGGADAANEYTFTVTNSHEPATYGDDGSLTVTKAWNDDGNRDGLETEITVQLEIDQVATGQTVTLDESNGWTDTFTDLPKYADGKEISYSVEEAEVPDGYTVAYTQSGNDWTITNTHESLLVSELTITKVWDDLDNKYGDRPDSVDVELQINGSTAVDANGVSWTATLTKGDEDADGNWTITVTDHPVFLDAEGQPITYTLHEDTVTDGYETEDGTVVITENSDSDATVYTGSVTITNTYTKPHLTVEKTADVEEGYVASLGDEITYTITVTNDSNVDITDITVKDDLTGLEETIEGLAAGESQTFTTTYTVTLDDITAGSIVNTATATGTGPDGDTEDTEGTGSVTVETDEEAFFSMDEEIVPDNDDEANPGSWVDKESVNEYDAIEIEMSTTIPKVSKTALASGDYSMTFHNELVSQLVLDDVESDFTVDINGTPVDHQYYEIDMVKGTSVRPMSLIQTYSISDDCTFHVNVDLSALYNDGVIKDDDLGSGTVRVFFYADLETTDVNGSYTSTAWYDVADGDTVIYTSDQSVVTVYTFEIIAGAYDNTTGAPLAGAEYGLYYDEDCTESVSRNGEPYVVTTDENGQAMYVGIAEGTYYVKELTRPDDHVSITEPMAVTLAGDENGNHVVEVMFMYSLDRGEFTIKITDKNGSYASGVEYEVYGPDGELVEAYTQGSSALAIPDLPIGDYTIKITVKNGYTFEQDEYVFTLVAEGTTAEIQATNAKTSSTGHRSSGGGGGGGGSSSRSVGTGTGGGATGHWILEGDLFTYPDGTHPSNQYLNIDGTIYDFYTRGFAVAFKHTEHYTEEAIAAAGHIPTATGTWETNGWWFEYTNGGYPKDGWAYLYYNGLSYWYYFDVDGWMVDGWLEWEGNTYYLDPVYDGWRGHMITGWYEIDGYWYYFGSDGAMYRNAETPDGYYVDANGRWIQ